MSPDGPNWDLSEFGGLHHCSFLRWVRGILLGDSNYNQKCCCRERIYFVWNKVWRRFTRQTFTWMPGSNMHEMMNINLLNCLWFYCYGWLIYSTCFLHPCMLISGYGNVCNKTEWTTFFNITKSLWPLQVFTNPKIDPYKIYKCWKIPMHNQKMLRPGNKDLISNFVLPNILTFGRACL